MEQSLSSFISLQGEQEAEAERHGRNSMGANFEEDELADDISSYGSCQNDLEALPTQTPITAEPEPGGSAETLAVAIGHLERTISVHCKLLNRRIKRGNEPNIPRNFTLDGKITRGSTPKTAIRACKVSLTDITFFTSGNIYC